MSSKNQPQPSYMELQSAKRNKLYVYFSYHFQALLLSLKRIIRTPFASFITLLVLGIAICLPASLYVLLSNIQYLSKGLDQSTQISVYLKSNIEDARVKTIVQQLTSKPEIAKVHYVSPAEGLAEFQQRSEFSQALNGLKSNPLPGVILVQPFNNKQSINVVNQLLTQLKQIADVDQVQLDMQWVQRLYAIIELGKRSVYFLSLLLGLGVVLIIGNTTYLTTQRHKREIEVLRMVGATNMFIRRPFLYSGIVYGLMGGAVAWSIILALVLWLQGPTSVLTQLYSSSFQLRGLNFEASLILLAIGMLLGFCGAWIALAKYLRRV